MTPDELRKVAALHPLSASVLALNSCQLSNAGREAVATKAVPPAKPRLRQAGKNALNKLEAEWFEHLKRTVCRSDPKAVVRPQAKVYVLANGVRYTPDFTAVVSGRETAWEVKGPKAWDDAMVKLKVAASVWPEVKWVLVWKHCGLWQEQEVLP